MTTISPGTKGTVLHPTQKRPLTVREYAHAQGFPDKYRFLSFKTIATQIVKDQLKQIGNAVPVHLALALGKALGEARIQDELDKTAFDGTENRDDTLHREMSEEL
ncbi:hypothetical protein DFH11DRAFT_1643383 [Phellopilus nigrolimitatus]|nr:hypothetical protein DFH11DRAFT_1643383 [Phellopilus nigrolimitatus]